MEQQNTKKYKILQNICQFMPLWKQLSPEDVNIQRMTGITNQIYKVTCPNHQPIIFRKFGQSETNVFLDRDAEEIVYKHISEQKQGPKIYGMNKTIRLESFIQSKILKTTQMLQSEYLEKVAYALHYFHQMKAPSINPKSLVSRIFIDPQSKILEICKKRLNQPIFDEIEKQDIEKLKSWVTTQEVQFLNQITSEIEKTPLVFSHNDLLANNILIKNSDNRIVFIDYEYSCFNYRIFDIANYFNETQYDYDVTQPPYFGQIPITQHKQKMKDKFIRCYCVANNPNFEEYMTKVKNDDFQLNQDQLKMYEQLKKQLQLGKMLSNIMWGWWAIIVCKNPLINFDYIKFAMKRYKDYMTAKNCKTYAI